MNKHRTLKAAFAAVLAALMAFAVFPVSALPAFEAEKSPVAPYWTVPEGYNAHDYNKMASFLEQEDENGVKNGQKLNPDYDVNDPQTWMFAEYDVFEADNFFEYVEIPFLFFNETITIGVEWENNEGEYYPYDGEYHVSSFIVPPLCRIYGEYGVSINPYLDETEEWDMVGNVDFSGMEYLYVFFVETQMLDDYDGATVDLSNCEMLSFLSCTDCWINELNISGSDGLCWVHLWGTKAPLDLTPLGGVDKIVFHLGLIEPTQVIFPQTIVEELVIYDWGNDILDLSGISGLQRFELHEFPDYPDWDNSFSGMTEIKYAGRHIVVEGGHSYIEEISYCHSEDDWYDYEEDYYEEDYVRIDIEDESLWEIVGWYDENGNPLPNAGPNIWGSNTYSFESAEETGKFIARIAAIGGDPVIGDTDGDGEISATDALMLMRYLVDEIDGSSFDIETADANGDGVIDLMDALIVLRMAIGAA